MEGCGVGGGRAGERKTEVAWIKTLKRTYEQSSSLLTDLKEVNLIKKKQKQKRHKQDEVIGLNPGNKERDSGGKRRVR